MLPLSLDLARLNLVLIGKDAPCRRRLALLEEAGAGALAIFSAAPSPELAQEAGGRLRRHWPSADELRGAQLVFIADVPEPERSVLVAAARAAGAILHVEDAPTLSDSHAPAVLRRGALVIAVSTDGAAPGLAVAIKQFLAAIIGPEWSARIEHMHALRRRWRLAGADHAALRRLTAARIGRYGWLNHRPLAANDRGAKMSERERGGVS
ncbi:MAG TPA: NAD(P)-dependent oxidoreductase [Stellaceae bacterium]|jgi:siroheme synthase-like protein|nr:NAD(P)-dependent oxidoreductase [Stellaceae bacterium]